jgi:transketolase
MRERKRELMSMRDAYGKALAEYGETNPNVVVLDADVSTSTRTHYFAGRFPDRFFNVGIAEANLVDVAAGLAMAGKVPFANTFAFLIALRAGEQVRSQVCLSRANVKLAAAYGGLSDSYDGPAHQSESDLAVMRAMPGLTVVVAADAVEAGKMVPLVAEYPGPVYLRLSRDDAPAVFDETYQPQIGRGVPLREGTDLTLVGTGLLVHRCLEAADALAGMDISAGVIEIHTLKPLDAELLTEAAHETGAFVTAEEHSVIGGLGGAVAELLGERCPVPLERVGLRERFGGTGPYAELLDECGLGVGDIVAAAKRAVARRRSGPWHGTR